jgi:hypothetical protein
MRRLNSERNRALLKAVERAGWRMRKTNSGLLIFPPDGSRPIALHASDRGGSRAKTNAEVQLRRAGLPV